MECRELTLSLTRVLPRSSRLLGSPRCGYQRNERRVSIQWLLCATNDPWPAVLRRTGKTVLCFLQFENMGCLRTLSTCRNVDTAMSARRVLNEKRLRLHTIYFPTARPTVDNPEGGLVDSQAEILTTLANDFKAYLKYRPDAHLILGGHADPRGSEEYNKGLTQRRVDQTKNFLVEHGVPADHFETRSFGKDDNLTTEQVKDQIAQNPELSPSDRQQMLSNLQVLVLANNRRVDVTLSTTGQQSVRGYPFNAKDYLALINLKGGEKKPVKTGAKKPAAKKPIKP